MSTMFHHKIPAPVHSPMLFTIPEAAWLAEIDQGAVRNEIKKKVVIKSNHNTVLLDWCAVSYLRSVRNLHNELTVELRRRIHQAIREALASTNHASSISFGSFSLCLSSVIEDMDRRSADLKEARDLVGHNPLVRGGEYVIRNTRIPVRLLAEIHRSGTSLLDLSEAYSLTERQVQLAVLFDRLHPRVGRPAGDIGKEWSDFGDVERADIEYLGELRKS